MRRSCLKASPLSVFFPIIAISPGEQTSPGRAARQPDRNLRKSGGLGYGTASALEEETR